MKLTHGLMAGQVLQRDAEGRGAAWISGLCDADGEVEIRILKAGKPVRGYDWASRGEARGGTFGATVTELRAGGPYRLELRVRAGRKVVDCLTLDEIFVGDVWILAGQSNMEGIGNMLHAPRPHEKVRAFYMRDEWGIAAEKLHFLPEAVDRFHNGYGAGPDRPSRETLEKVRSQLVKGVSPGHAFGLEMLRRTGVPQGLIPCAHGGTSMAQWSPTLRDQGGASLYGAMMRRFEKLSQSVAGVLWYQGESDANADAAAVYTDRMIELVAATRRDMALPKLPWVVVQLGCHACPDGSEAWNSIQEQQRRLPEVIKHLDVAPAIDLELDDGIHIGGRGQMILGRRLARLADRILHKSPGVKPGIIVKQIALVPTPGCNVGAPCTSVEITYGNVAGKLVSAGRPAGFALLDHAGRDLCGIYKTTIEGRRVLLHTNMSRFQLEMLSVSYGHGRYPVCTVTDSEGMSLPVMQSVPVAPDHAPSCTDWESTLLEGVNSLARAGLARIKAACGWRKAAPRGGFGVLPKPAEERTVGVFAMRTTLTAGEPLEATLLFGANAPYKLWLNGKLLLADATCTVPLNPSQYRAQLNLKRGRNPLLVAFAPPDAGAHLGICACVGTAELRADPRVGVGC